MENQEGSNLSEALGVQRKVGSEAPTRSPSWAWHITSYQMKTARLKNRLGQEGWGWGGGAGAGRQSGRGYRGDKW